MLHKYDCQGTIEINVNAIAYGLDQKDAIDRIADSFQYFEELAIRSLITEGEVNQVSAKTSYISCGQKGN